MFFFLSLGQDVMWGSNLCVGNGRVVSPPSGASLIPRALTFSLIGSCVAVLITCGGSMLMNVKVECKSTIDFVLHYLKNEEKQLQS